MGMTIKVTVTCSMCFPPKKRALKMDIEGPKDLDPETLKARIEGEGWIVQFNGDNMDTYCTEKCAE